MIDMTLVNKVLDECVDLVDDLDGIEYHDDGENKVPREERELRVQSGRKLQMLSDRLALAQSLVMVEFWKARGQENPLL